MKTFVSILLSLCIIFNLSITAFADDVLTPPTEETSSQETVQPRIEEKEWVYRVYNGNLERRLWSNTYGKWLTDWIIVGPYQG